MNKISRRDLLRLAALGAAAAGVQGALAIDVEDREKVTREFDSPPDDARPWVYWYFMDGNLRREGMDADLAAMKRAGLGGAIYLEVGIGIEPGPIAFMSDPWQELVGHAFEEADRLGLQMSLGAGPGWCGTGGPWMTPDRSMQHLVASTTLVQGPAVFNARLPRPKPRTPFFGTESLTPELRLVWQDFYRDEYVLAFPTPANPSMIADIDEKALYTRGSYSSQIVGPAATRAWVRPFFTSQADTDTIGPEHCVSSAAVVDLSAMLGPDGHLEWNVPPGSWTIMRCGRTLTGQTTRPAPKPGLGLESDKFDATAMDTHFDAYILPLLKKIGTPRNPGRGLVALHYDSWEMSSQNWSPRFRQEFERRRGYDPFAMLPSFAGLVVDSPEISERFLWDIRQTANELICNNQAQRLRERAGQFGLSLELEPYDLNPAGDLDLGTAADLPMAEFWTRSSSSPPTDFSLAEAASVGHTEGCRIIGAEAFTATMDERWHQHPASMKAQGDWAFCQGINKFVIHRFQAQPWLDRFPGMTMGPDGGYGVHWDRTQTWWDFASAYHLYLSRCQSMLRQGLAVADILYLVPEGAPNVFFPPRSAFRPGLFFDRRGYNFDGCAAQTLISRGIAKDGCVAFPDGMAYRILVLPRQRTMTPLLLEKIVALVDAGVTVLGMPPEKSPSLSDHPQCDRQVRDLASRLWPQHRTRGERTVGRGRVVDDFMWPAEVANPLSQAKWIWSASETGLSTVANNNPTFRREFTVENPGSIDTAVVTLTADESYELFLNGQLIARGSAEQRVRRLDISGLVAIGTNRLSVSVRSSIDTSRQPGLIASLAITYRDGHRAVIDTDQQWSWSSGTSTSETSASELGSYERPPWNLGDSSLEQADIYPSYARTAEVLQRMGVEPDFESDVPLRYTHRKEKERDIYFIANGESGVREVRCRFRVTGRQPEWWNPISSERHDLPAFTQVPGRTEISIRLDPLESGFVVFRRPATSRRQGLNRRTFRALATLNGPWQVAFDPNWGGPPQIVFQTLDDWTLRPEPGVRHYSGKATYTTRFDCGESDNRGRICISLGRVANIASVKINGQDIGVAWCEPWRLLIPQGFLRPHDNLLEVTVANLWVNRLIGDCRLPEDQRLTRVTGNPFHEYDALLPSGLLGPVILQTF